MTLRQTLAGFAGFYCGVFTCYTLGGLPLTRHAVASGAVWWMLRERPARVRPPKTRAHYHKARR